MYPESPFLCFFDENGINLPGLSQDLSPLALEQKVDNIRRHFSFNKFSNVLLAKKIHI